MTRSRWVLAGLALLLAAGVLLLVARTPTGGRERAGARTAPPDAPAAPEREAERTPNAPAAELPAASAPQAESARAPVAGPASAPDPGPAWEIEVVAAGSLAPVPGAALWLRESGNAEPLELGPLVEDEAPHRTDGSGRARVPASAETHLVVARSGTLTGVARIEDPATTRAVRVELHPDFDLRVEVRHAGGAPAAEVAIALGVPPMPRWKALGRSSDAEGRVTFAHVGLMMAQRHELEGEVRVARPLDAPLARSFDARRPPRAPLVFVLPPCAEVRVRVVGADGEPVSDGTRLGLAHLPPGTERDLSPFASGEREYLQARTRAGVADFPCVELGGELELLVYSDSRDVLLRAFRPAPDRPGGREEHALVLELDHPVLVFRVLDGDGAVLANEELSLRLVQRSGWNHGDHSHTQRTDADGRFPLALVDPFREGDQRQLTLEARAGSLGTQLDLARPFEPGEVPMGDLRLATAPLLVAGRVLDGDGAGVAATVTLHYPVRDEDGETVWYWQGWDRPLASAADGAFEVRAFLEEREFRLEAHSGELRSGIVAAERGERGVELRLLRAGWIEGDVLLDEGLPSQGITLELRSSEVQGNAPDARQEQLAPEARFRFADLAPGSYDLALGVRGQDDVVRVEGLVVPSGGPCVDPRLTLDLRGRLHWMRFVLVATEPVASLAGTLQYWPSGSSSGRRRHHWFEGSPVDLLTLEEHIDLLLNVPGYRPVRLVSVRAGQEVVLQPALTARLQLPPGVRLPEPPLYVKATLVMEGAEEGLDFGGAAFDERREITCRAPAPGRLLVRWIVERRGNDGASATTLEGIPAQYVELVEGVQEPHFVLTIEDAALQEALAKSGF